MLYLLYPEVAGGWGPQTVITNQAEIEAGVESIPDIEFLEYVFDDWLGDALLTSFPVFIITEQLANDMIRNSLSGIRFEKVETTKSNLFEELNPAYDLPAFNWLIPEGRVTLIDDQFAHEWSGHDLCLNQYGDLVVTEKCMKVLQKYRLEQCTIGQLILMC